MKHVAPRVPQTENSAGKFYSMRLILIQTPKKDILVVQGDWNAKVGNEAHENWQGICGPFCKDDSESNQVTLIGNTVLWYPISSHTARQIRNFIRLAGKTLIAGF